MLRENNFKFYIKYKKFKFDLIQPNFFIYTSIVQCFNLSM